MQIRSLAAFFAACLAVQGAKASDIVLGANFVISHPTDIGAIGIYDGGTALTTDETVGIFDALTGNLTGPDVLFGPGISGNQVGNIFYESVAPFSLAPGDYSIIELSSAPADGAGSDGGDALSGGDAYQNLGDTADLPGGSRFNSGTDFEVTSGGSSCSGSGSHSLRSFDLADPAPDGGATAMLLAGALAGIGWVRRKM